jgi:hypothetical protein
MAQQDAPTIPSTTTIAPNILGHFSIWTNAECKWSTKRITNESKQNDLPTKANKHMLRQLC